jgi:Domain of unknown function (DUF1905)
MEYIVQSQELVLEYWPGKGAWTYRLTIPNSQHIPGTWGHIKVSGTIDDYVIQSRNLAPLKSGIKMLSVNADIRKHTGKQAGDKVRVTLYLEPTNLLREAADVLSCLEDADVLGQFNALSAESRDALLHNILSQPDEVRQEKKLLACIDTLSKQPAR